jgi:tRNA-dihydrouridine synthase B
MSSNFWHEKIKVGNISFPRIMAAPLDGITDSPLRQLIREFSPETLLFGEMRHVACVANAKDNVSLTFEPNEHPIAYQVSANRLEYIEKAIEKIIEHKFDMFNLNAGCPSKTVTKSGSGSALMADPERLKTLLLQMKQALAGRIPLTLKMRAGFKEVNGLEIAAIAEEVGVEMLIIHPRTAPGGFTSPLNYELVKQIKEMVSMPVIFSGNVNSFTRAQKMHELTGIDGVMVGRALWGCPWKIAEMEAERDSKPFFISSETSMQYALKHLELNQHAYKNHGFIHFKKQVCQYLKGITNAAEMRAQLLRSQSHDAMKEILLNILQKTKEFSHEQEMVTPPHPLLNAADLSLTNKQPTQSLL